ncbi:MAG: LysE family translocator [Gammaproteobacteria bacterium]|nr:LysE family translocator [Gammaproteobacteria bacterium]
MNESQIVFFVLISLFVILIPGQDLVLVMSRGMTQGAKAGIATAAGVSTGLLGHTMLTAFGLGALLMSSEIFFALLKYLGAAYLSYLGLKLIFSPVQEFKLERVNSRPLGKLFAIGALSNISNPKITIFYFAFLPQFISTDVENPTLLLLSLGFVFAALTFLVKAPIGYFAGVASAWIRSRPIVIKQINRISGTVLIGLGIKLAFEQR